MADGTMVDGSYGGDADAEAEAEAAAAAERERAEQFLNQRMMQHIAAYGGRRF